MTTRRQLLVVLLASAGIGAVASGLLTAAWVGENLSGDFADLETGAIDVRYTAVTFATCFAFFAVPLATIGGVGVLMRALFSRQRHRSVRRS